MRIGYVEKVERMDTVFVWGLRDILFVVGCILLVIYCVPFVWTLWLAPKVTEIFCKHEKYYENGQCHGVCRKCGKDLGFIGTLRDRDKSK
jgi:hypothetical protein